MKIAIAVEGTRGDVYPMLALAETLTRAGHGVRLIGPPDFEAVAESRGIEFWRMGEPVRPFLEETAEAIQSRGLRFVREINRWGKQSVEHQFREIPEATRGMDRVFAAGTILAAGSAAERHDIPFRYVLYTPGMIPSVAHTPVFLPFQVESHFANRCFWAFVKALTNGWLSRDVNRLRRVTGLAPVKDLFGHVLSERPILAVDRDLAPVPTDSPYAIEQIRCLHPAEGEPLPPKLETFLESGPPPVYLGFGSMTDPHPERTTRRMLEALSALGCRALISKGWAGLGDGPLPDGVMAIDPVSHASLFPRMAAVAHHGGAGTTHVAARSGVPQILVPHVLDQFYFARCIQAHGVGPPAIPRGQLTAERLTGTLRATLDNELLAERAAELGQRLAALGSTEPDLDRLLAST
jgi:UDP:flavonoid glycosyltransferase YjiC (YdhE family)